MDAWFIPTDIPEEITHSVAEEITHSVPEAIVILYPKKLHILSVESATVFLDS